jgi:hypothetical protein
MWMPRSMFRPRADVLALETSAVRARSALACCFSSADEFEAAVIRAQRAAGVYGPKRQRRQLAGLAAAMVLAGLLVSIV